jgi:hypothetical protein
MNLPFHVRRTGWVLATILYTVMRVHVYHRVQVILVFAAGMDFA